MMIRRQLSLTAAVLALGLTGCTGLQTPPTRTADTSSPSSPATEVDQLLDRATGAAPIKAARLRAEAARKLIAQGRQQDASRLLARIYTRSLPPGLAFEIIALQAQDALQQQRPRQALRFLTQPRQNTLPAPQALELSELRLRAYELNQDPVGQTRELINQGRLNESTTPQQQERIWRSLSQLAPETVSQLTTDSNNSYHEQGWFELANDLHNAGDLEQKSDAIQRWQTLWEKHPATATPPSSLQALQTQNRDIQQIALLLPQSGPLHKPARAISEGFLTAYYSAQAEGKAVPMVTLLDSSQLSDPLQLSAELSRRQIDMVIGPLDKQYVQRLMEAAPLTAPILALNYAESAVSGNSNLFQFGLSAEDEARQAARQAWQDGHRQAAVLTADTSWGRKVATAFTQAFSDLGGEVHGTAHFSEGSYDATVAQLMNTDKSRARAKQVRKLIRRKVEFEEYRRQDLDMVFLSALPTDARQINPTLSFHFANDLPVYATSHVYNGTPDAMNDQDLSGIRFLDSPWNLDTPSANKRSLARQRNDVHSRFGRLYALGMDAFQLHPYLLQLAALPQSSISGETGRLSVTADGRVQRTLNWAVFNKGVPRLLAPIDRSNQTANR